MGFSTAYIYKFFDSKQSIGEAICCICLGAIDAELSGIASSEGPSAQRLRMVFRSLAAQAQNLSLHESRLREMVAAAHREGWKSFRKHEAALHAIIKRLIDDGRQSGEFERKTPAEEVCRGVMLALEPLRNPALWTQNVHELDDQALLLATLVLKSLAP